jgi:hypothetical protein
MGTGLFNVEYIDVNMLKLEQICLIYRRCCLSLQIRNLHNCKNMLEHHVLYKIKNKFVGIFFCQIGQIVTKIQWLPINSHTNKHVCSTY